MDGFPRLSDAREPTRVEAALFQRATVYGSGHGLRVTR